MSTPSFGRTGRRILGASAFVGVAAVVGVSAATIGHSMTPKVPVVTVTHSPAVHTPTPSSAPIPTPAPTTAPAPTTTSTAPSPAPSPAAPTHTLHEYVGTPCEVPGEHAITVGTGAPLVCTAGTWQAVAG